MWFALRGDERFKIGVVKGVDVRTDDDTDFLDRGFDEVTNAKPDEIAEDRMWLAFRTSAPGEDAVLIETFRKIGFEPCQSREPVKYDSTTVFGIEMRKDALKCR